MWRDQMLVRAIDRCRAEPNRRELMFSSTFRRSETMFKHHAPPGDATVSLTRRTWTFPNGSLIEFGYNDPDRHRGQLFSAIDCDSDVPNPVRAWLQTRREDYWIFRMGDKLTPPTGSASGS